MLPEVTLSRFLLLPELKLTHIVPMSRSGAIYKAEKVSDFEVCPKCASKSDKIYDRRWIKVKDEPIRGKYVILKIRKRRFFCKKCQKPFTEGISGISKGKRTTERFRSALLWATENFIDLKRVQRVYRCSRGLLYKVVYEQLERKRRTRLYDLPSVIGIDEHSLRKRKYQSVGYVTVIVDHKNKRLYEVIDGRNKVDLEDVAVDFKRPENVKVVTLDLS